VETNGDKYAAEEMTQVAHKSYHDPEHQHFYEEGVENE